MANIYRNLLTIVLCLVGTTLMAQGIRGKVTDAASGAPIPGASVSVVDKGIGATSNANGDYTVNVASGSYQVKVSFIGYQTQTLTVRVGNDQATLNVTLSEAASGLGEVVVVGSRSQAARTNIDTPVPVDVISAKELKGFGQVDVTQIMNFVAPSFNSNRQTVADGTDHVDPATLRGLGPDQVLVLVNGKRRHSSALLNINGTVGRGSVGTDMNVIPVSAIERIEVLRDGAAAQYGSDAIAGVINIVMKSSATGSFNAMYGQSLSESVISGETRKFRDGKNIVLDFYKGFNLADKGFFSIAAQYNDREETNRTGRDTRPLLFRGGAGGSAWPATPAGQDVATWRRSVKADDDAQAKALGLDRFNMRVGNSNSRNIGVFINSEYKLGGSAEAYLSGGITSRGGDGAGFYRIPGAASQMDLTLYPKGFLPEIHTNVADLSLILGVKGKMGEWNYDVSNTYGSSSVAFDIKNTLNASLPVGTSPKEFDAGQIKFGQNTFNVDFSRKIKTVNLAFGGEFRRDQYEIIAGEEMSYSFGRPSQGIAGRTGTAPGAQVFPGFQPSNQLNEARTNIAGYLDLEADLTSKLLVGLAGRVENYSDFGGVLAGKLSARYKITNGTSLRGAVSNGFRAPSLQQRYFNNTSTQFVNGLPNNALTVNNDDPVVKALQVPGLKAETSVNMSIGLATRLGKNTTLTIDAYQTDIDDRIVLSQQFTRGTTGVIATALNNANIPSSVTSLQFFTNAISTRTKGLDIILSTRANAGRGKLLFTVASNFNETSVRGALKTTSVLSQDANLQGGLLNRLERGRLEVAQPRSKINLSILYTLDKFDVNVRAVRFGSVKFVNNLDPAIASNNLPLEIDQTFTPKMVTDLTVNYRPTKALTFTLGANNLFDIYPDKAYIDPRNSESNLNLDASTYSTTRDNTSNGRFIYSRNVTQFGFNGRFVYGKVGINF